LTRLLEVMPEAVVETHARGGDATAVVERSRLLDVLALLRNDGATSCEMLIDLCAVDRAEAEPRFEVVYHLYSVSQNHRLRVKARVPEHPCEIDSVTALWPAAGWMEREVFDLFGIRFKGHPDLRRLLLEPSFEGHPLRKDHPTREVRSA
jgi:NADH-quinone oxidoreductase subunit C